MTRSTKPCRWPLALAAAGMSFALVPAMAGLYDAWGTNFFLTMLNAAAQGRRLRVEG